VMLGSAFLRRFLQDHPAGRNSIIAPPESKPASEAARGFSLRYQHSL
jgi:hypothetical protein